ncbi:hypothetical protein F4561_005842 [Lipingzhangella halophila]|uniref:Ferritin-like domain-containing protein n=1 Tax=Lipingzhangella halophila TaxID=1783352 RepID=A0A7W7W5Q1_9ACTN|nr:ferritin-like domain-containing protein [Lipingzhangella halophila]MBB4934948.1 hypothetical protein [Lipingzhangella halophila]
MGEGGFQVWTRRFGEDAERRRDTAEPDWALGATLAPAVIRSLQRFQTGEDGDGAVLVRKSARAADPDYLAAVRLFVAEEQNHARLLALLLDSAGAPTIAGHWSDTVFVTVRNALGLRLELMTLMVAEVVALRYYRALRDGTDDALLADVAGRILADEERHVPFHTQRLREGFGHLPWLVRVPMGAGWWTLLLGAGCVVALDHGPALRHVGVGRRGFVSDVAGLFRPVVAEVLGSPTRRRRWPRGAGVARTGHKQGGSRA